MPGPFYRPSSGGGGGGGRGVSLDGAKGGHKFLENVLEVTNALHSPAAGREAAGLFAKALSGASAGAGAAAFDKVAGGKAPALQLDKSLPKMELGNSQGAGAGKGLSPDKVLGADKVGVGKGFGRAGDSALGGSGSSFMHTMADLASKMGNPVGFMNAVFDFIKAVLAEMGTAVVKLGEFSMQQLEEYGQAAEVAILEDAKHLAAST